MLLGTLAKPFINPLDWTLPFGVAHVMSMASPKE